MRQMATNVWLLCHHGHQFAVHLVANGLKGYSSYAASSADESAIIGFHLNCAYIRHTSA